MTKSAPYGEPESVPEGYPNLPPNVEPTIEVAFEPLPLWDQAIETWQWTWDLHWAGLGTLFSLLALYALWSLIDLAGKKYRRKPLLAIVISSLLLTFASTRAAFLFINPYESPQCFLPTECPVILSRALFGIALPCVTSSFFLVHLAFLQLSKLKLYPEKLQSVKFVACVIVFHFSLASFTVAMISLYADWTKITIVCESFFIVLSLILSVSFIYSGRIILKSVKESRSTVRQYGDLNTTLKPAPNVAKLVKITYITVFLGLASIGLQLYSILVVHNMYSNDGVEIPQPWPWLIFESLFRLVEFGLGCTMAYVNPRQVSCKRRPRKGIFLGHRKKSGGWSIYLQNQSSGDLSEPTSPADASIAPLEKNMATVELGIVNEGGSFEFPDDLSKEDQFVSTKL